ncbi:sensor histidine kinase [Kribbella catacumbae]|uniref:sensor histidine kinase n=1 Tax=Kribbella catacumbae TaxID=460086 RepID=UPI00037368B9|nr:histidine kinase [Kribbella catacumbae]
MVGSELYAERRPWLTDAVIVLALLGGAILGANLASPNGERPADGWIAEALAVVACLALFQARRYPRTIVIVTTVCVVSIGAIGYVLSPLLLAPLMVALYWLAAKTTTTTAWTYGGIATVLVVAIAVGLKIDQAALLRTAGPALWLLLPLVLGSRSQLHRAYLDAVHARAEYAERTREEEARLRVAEERMRIARDLHDVVAHHMAVANAQAGTAAHLLGTDSEVSKKLLADLQVTTSTVMLELRATLGVLRSVSDTDADTLEPAPGLAQLPNLLEACNSAGLKVDFEVEGEPQEVPPGVDLTAYRIIQEALTNATKYSAAPAASLRLTYGSSRLTIRVTNETSDAHAGPADSGGYGILGMRERAQAVGGHLEVNGNETGFEVLTTLPLQPQAPELPRTAPESGR